MSTKTTPVKLGERFAKLHANKGGATKSQFQVKKQERVITAVNAQKGKRDAKFAQARGTSPQGKTNNNKGNKKQGQSPAGKKLLRPNSAGSGKGKGNNNNAKAGGKKKGAGPKPEKKPTAESLDFQMDNYWHAGGKGPDPKQKALDSQLDTYFSSKQQAAAEGAAGTEATA